MTQVLHSKMDSSVNFVTPCLDGGAFEARYVRREESYFICYLSSHSGCNQACRFCHLTQTGQTMMTPATIDDYLAQARQVLDHYAGLDYPAERVNFNFMARGEPLLNPAITDSWEALYDALRALAEQYGVEAKFNISTIMPVDFKDAYLRLPQIFKNTEVHFYYSAYTAEHDFRRRWLPKAWSVRYALEAFAIYLNGLDPTNKSSLTLHWAMIEGENDRQADLDSIVENVRYEKLNVKFNLVRYNPYSPAQGQETNELKLRRNFEYLNRAFDHPASRIVPRVGFDVQASCGMFVNAEQVDDNSKSAKMANGK